MKRNGRGKLSSRKFWLALFIIVAATILLGLPAIMLLLGAPQLVFISGSEYVSLVIAIYGLYAAGNIGEHHVLGKFAGKNDDDATKD